MVDKCGPIDSWEAAIIELRQATPMVGVWHFSVLLVYSEIDKNF